MPSSRFGGRLYDRKEVMSECRGGSTKLRPLREGSRPEHAAIAAKLGQAEAVDERTNAPAYWKLEVFCSQFYLRV